MFKVLYAKAYGSMKEKEKIKRKAEQKYFWVHCLLLSLYRMDFPSNK
jgi:hypothetical protein